MLRLKTFGGLWIEGREANGAGPRPRSLALLAICAAAGAKGVSRERVLGVLWPESHPERARHALSQALYSLKRDAGAEVVVGSTELRLDPGQISSDVDEFREAARSNRWADAASLYAGPFLDGFYLNDAPEFERWIDSERSSLEADAERVMQAAASTAMSEGRRDDAAEFLRRLTRINPGNSRFAAQYMEALAARGDRAGAVAHGKSHLELLHRDFELDPDAELEQLIARLRESPPPAIQPATSSASRDAAVPATAQQTAPDLQPAAAIATEPVPGSDFAPPRHQRRGRLVLAAVALVAVAVFASLGRGPASLAGGIIRPVLAVGQIRDVGAPDSIALIAADLGARVPPGSVAEVSTRSPVAFHLYEEGLRAFFQFDAVAARRLFQAALHEDSTFAMAAYYTWRAALATGDLDEARLAERSLALAPAAPARDRLLIVTHVGSRANDVRTLASAETLAVRYPNDPEALVRAGEVTRNLERAVSLLDRSIELDSTAGLGVAAICRLCEALNVLATRYEWADSDAAVRRTLDRWRAMRPSDAAPWTILADWVIGFGRTAEANAATARAVSLGAHTGGSHLATLVRALRLDDFKTVDDECTQGLATESPAEFADYRWYCTIGMRSEGRYREALTLVRDGRGPQSRIARRDVPHDPYMPAILDWEMARGITAADQFLALARAGQDGQQTPRSATWLLTLAASAFVAANDTISARHLVDSIEVTGSRSAFRRDALLHHFVRGLLYSRAHQDDAAVREFRAALDSPTFGYTRINLELGRALLRLHRPHEAIPLLQGALHGGIEGSGLYITRTELHELLAQLFAADGQRDSAATHYGIVSRAWASGDPFLTTRRDTVERWLSGEGRPAR